MTDNAKSAEPSEAAVNLKDPFWAGILAWLWPGMGHLYQGRIAKGILYMVCILGIFFFGLILGGGHVVYAGRISYFCQAGAGAPALPALVQSWLVRGGRAPIDLGTGRSVMAPPRRLGGGEIYPNELALWNAEYGVRFEMGTLYTMIAGLLNILVIYDAVAGPVLPVSRKSSKKGKEPASSEKEPEGDLDKEPKVEPKDATQ